MSSLKPEGKLILNDVVVHKTLVIRPVHQELRRELNEYNWNGSILSSTQPNRSVETFPPAEEPADRQADSGASGGAGGLQSVKDASRRVASVFGVENPHDIDRRARTVFPAAFLVINVLYWLYYLFL